MGYPPDCRSGQRGRELNETLRALVVLNLADAQGQDNKDAAEAVQEVEGLELLPITIGRRKAFPNAASAGRAVTEYVPRDVKAVDELTQLARLIYPAS